MPYHEFTTEDIPFRAVPFRNTPNNGDLTLHIYCTCRHCATVNSNNHCRKLGAIIHYVNPEDNHAALPFRLEPPGEQADFVELPARATSLRQGTRDLYEAISVAPPSTKPTRRCAGTANASAQLA